MTEHVRIENNGEFIHANPKTDGVQGSENVTHGCVNLSTDNAEQYFQTAIFGDPVEVTNSPIPLTMSDGDNLCTLAQYARLNPGRLGLGLTRRHVHGRVPHSGS